MRKAGVDQTVIMKLTGHKTLAMFNRYNTVDQVDAMDAMRRLDRYLLQGDGRQSSDEVQTEGSETRNPKNQLLITICNH